MIDFQNEELVILKKEFDDTNIQRIYKVVDKEDDLIKVEVVIETPYNLKEKLDNSMKGKIFGPFEQNIFQKYL